MDGVRLHSADKSRTARFQAWWKNHPGITVTMVAAFLGRSPKTIYRWRIGRPYEIPDLALRLLEQSNGAVFRGHPTEGAGRRAVGQ